MAADDVLHKEIDLIQACISRMAQNSFLIKGWTISLVVVVLALYGKVHDLVLVCAIMLIPVIAFWYLDAFFLQTEKMYREMYSWVLEKRAKNDHSFLYDLNPLRFKDSAGSRVKVMFSVTLRIFYGVPFAILIGIMIYQNHDRIW